MPYALVKISPRKYKVVNTDTKVEHAHATSKKKGEAQIRLLNMLHHQSGTGFFSDLGNSIKNVANQAVEGTQNIANKAVQGVQSVANQAVDLGNKIINPSSAYPPELKQLKDDIGTEIITDIEVRRTPVPDAISGAMNVVSLGSFKKKMGRLPFDQLFHLFLVAKTDKGHSFLLEKNSRIHTTRNVPNLANTTTMKVANIQAGLTVADLIDNTQTKMGDNFLPYSPTSNNCQDFIFNILTSNKLDTPELTSFVKQNTDSLFKDDKSLASISTGLTNLGASFDVAIHGGALKHKKMNNSHFISSVNIHMNQFTHKLPQSEGQIRSALGIPVHVHYYGMEGSGIDWSGIGKSIGNALHIPTTESGAKDLAKQVISVALPSAGAAVGGAAGSLMGPIGGIVGGTFGGIGGRVGAQKANEQIGSGLRKRGRPRKMVGNGWLSSVLDRPFTARDVIRGAKSLPDGIEGMKQDIAGGSMFDGLVDIGMNGVAGKQMPKVHHGGVLSLMNGQGAGKGSEAMRLKMQKLRSMRKSKK